MLIENKSEKTTFDKVSNYHSIDKLSASTIKLFDRSRSDFYKEVVLKQGRDEKLSPSIVLGNICDFWLSECQGDEQEFTQRFDEKFVLMSVKKGTGQAFVLADALFQITLDDMVDGEPKSGFADRFAKAFEIVQRDGKYKGKTVEWATEDFNKSDACKYLEEMLNNLGKNVVDQWMLDKARICVQKVLNDPNVGELFKDKKGLERFGKTVIEWEYLTKDCKTEIDDFRIDHNTKEIIITEIKSNFQIESFEYTYLKLRYDLSAIFYTMAVKHWLLFQTDPSKYQNYNIRYQFLTVDTSPENLRPILYTLSEKDLEKAFYGYNVRGKEYKGLKQLVDEIIWAEKTSNWDISKTAFDAKNSLPLIINYD